MAHFSGPVLKIDIGLGDGATSTQGSKKNPVKFKLDIPHERLSPEILQLFDDIPVDLKPFLLELILLKPDNGLLHYFQIQKATFTVLSKRQYNQEDLHRHNWMLRCIPVQNQKNHDSCWAINSSENISDARFFHLIDGKHTSYSHQFLLDFCNDKAAEEKYETSGKYHYCYGFSSFKGLEFAMLHGIPTSDAWTGTGCGTPFRPRNVSEVRSKHVLNDVRGTTNVRRALRYLKKQPILGTLALFYPEFRDVKHRIYRGPTSPYSKFSGWHTVSIRTIETVGEETVAIVKNSHGIESGSNGYIKVSLDIMLLEVKSETNEPPSFPLPAGLFQRFMYGEVRSKFEKEVKEYYLGGEKIDGLINISDHMAFITLEGIYQNTSGHVYTEDGKTEIIGSPVQRAIFKLALKMQSDMKLNYDKSKSITIKGSPCNSKPRCLGIAVTCREIDRKGIRIHWKGRAATILDKCTKIGLDEDYMIMSEAKRSQLKGAIKDMDAKGLITIALAYNNVAERNFPLKKNRKIWRLPCEELILLAIFGINDPCPPAEDDEIRAATDFYGSDDDEDVEEDASKAHLGERAICPTIAEGLKKFGDVDGIVDEQIGNEPEFARLCDEISNVGEDMKPHQWRVSYDIGLCGRLGLYCYNFQKGTDYEFKFVREIYSGSGLFITLEAMDPADSSPLTFEMVVKHVDLTEGVQLCWETCICRVEGSKEADHEWDNESIDDRYKGELPKWLSDDNQQQCYVVQESELLDKDNWWLHLFSEIAFYTKWHGALRPRDVAECLPLEPQKVVVETRGEAAKEPREKLNNANAIFYITFECGNDPITGKVANYRAVVRKTMDGKPGHMRLEVRCWTI